MKKTLILFFAFMFLISFASAELTTWDNRGTYNEETRTITIRDLTGVIGEAKLNTPLDYKVGAGYQKVAEFDLWAYEDYNDIIRSIKFYDKNYEDWENKELTREFDIRYKVYEDTPIDDYGCINYFQNGSCINYGVVSSHIESKEVWKKVTPAVLKKNEYVTVGIFTNVEAGDKVEWIPNIYGVEVVQWALWTASLDVGLMHHWALNETSGVVVDALGTNNGAATSVTRGVTGKIGNAFDFDGSGYVSLSNVFGNVPDDTFSISAWNYRDNVAGDLYIFSESAGSGSRHINFWINGGTLYARTYSGASSMTLSASLGTIDWKFVTFTYNTTHGSLYINGVLVDQDASVNIDTSAYDQRYIGADRDLANKFQGILDEVTVWNRSLTIGDIELLYNNGDGLNYYARTPPDLPPHIIGLLPENNSNYSSSTININFTAWDDINLDNVTWNIDGINESINTSGFNNTLYNYQKVFTDGIHNFTVYATDNSSQVNQSETRYLMVDTTNPSVLIDYPTGTISTLADGQSVDLNTTITDTNLDSCWYSYNGTNTTIPSCADTTFTYVAGLNSITVYANDTIGNTNSSTSSWDVKILVNSQTYSSTSVEGALENFSADLTVGTGIEIASAVFNYNGESEVGSIDADGDTRILSISEFQIPDFPSDTNVTFYWTITLSDSTVLNLSSKIQSVSSVDLDNCSTNTFQLFNISLYDEETLLPLLGNIEVFYEVLNKPAYSLIQSFSGEFNNVSNTLVCSNINLSNQNLAYSSEIRYYSTDYATDLYHIQKADIGSIVQLDLYDLPLNDTTEFKVTYQDDTFRFIEGAILQLRRKYIAEDLYRVVEAPLTSNEGVTVLHINLDSVKYAATVVKDGEVLDTFDNLVFKCENELSGICEMKLLGEIDPQNVIDYDTERDFTYTVIPGNNNITITYSIPSSVPGTINLVLEQKDQFGNKTQCNKTIISSSGSIQCAYNESITTSYLELSLYKDGELTAYNTYVIDENTGADFLDNNYIIVVVLILSLVGMALSSPEWMIMNAIITLVLSGMLWLVNGLNFVAGLGILMWLVIAAGILILKISKQEDR